MLTESLLLGMTGGGAGLVMSVWGINLLRAGCNFNEIGRQMAERIRLDQRTLLFTAATSLLTTILFGLLPAIRASKINPGDALSESGRTGLSSFTRTRLRSVLVTGEIALALALLAGAGVMMREVRREFSVKKGFTLDHVLLAEINLKSRQYEKPEAQIAFFQQATQRVGELPGVDSSSVATATPLEGSWSTPFSIVGQPSLEESKRPEAQGFVVGPDYFRTMQIPLLRGRTFSNSDDSHAAGVAIVNQEFARRFFPHGEAIGQQIELDDGHHRRVQIIGVVGDVLAYFGQVTPNAQIYQSSLQVPCPSMRLVLRSRVAPLAMAPMLRRAVWSVDKDQPVGRIETMEDVAAGNAGGDNLVVALMGIFAALALVLAAVGIYGVVAYAVSQRRHEMGIRVALGAQKKDVLGLVLRQGGLLTGIGCAVGLVLALPLPRVFGGLFPEFQPQGPVVAIAVALIVAIVSLLATYIPARRVTNVDPMVALRYE
jgi:putative ABC transport system permease protein